MKLLLATLLALSCFTVSTVYCAELVPTFVPHELAETFRFTFEAKKLETTSAISTPRINLDFGSSSIVEFKLKTGPNASSNASPNVTIALEPTCTNSEPLHIRASFKLLGQQNREDVTSISATVSKHLVDQNHCDTAYLNFIDYYDLMANYTEYGNVTFEIEIAADRVHPNLRPKAFGVVGRKFLIELKNVNLNTTAVNQIEMPIFDVRDIRFKLYAEKSNEHLGIYLQANEYDLNTWYYKVHTTFALLSFKKGVDPMKYTFTHTYSLASPNHGNGQLIKLSELYDSNKQFIFNNSLKLLVEIHVE